MRGVMAISGGVGGAKLALGLAAQLDPRELLIVGNTGDDFEHLGLRICPDLDTLMYALAGLADPERGWGLAGESWACLEALGALDGPQWFRLGDRDLATHLRRSEWLRAGLSLSEVTRRLAGALGVQHALVPMSDADVRTMVRTPDGELAFQEYFVRERCEPQVLEIRFAGAAQAGLSPALHEWLQGEAGIAVICPSNPFLSVDPFYALPGLREALTRHKVVAVSPIVGGRALKGPAAKLMAELQLPVSSAAVARYYQGRIAGLVIDRLDVAEAEAVRACDMEVLVTDTVMNTPEDKHRLAAEVLEFAARLAV